MDIILEACLVQIKDLFKLLTKLTMQDTISTPLETSLQSKGKKQIWTSDEESMLFKMIIKEYPNLVEKTEVQKFAHLNQRSLSSVQSKIQKLKNLH